jgi:hypothetical protein
MPEAALSILKIAQTPAKRLDVPGLKEQPAPTGHPPGTICFWLWKPAVIIGIMAFRA